MGDKRRASDDNLCSCHIKGNMDIDHVFIKKIFDKI